MSVSLLLWALAVMFVVDVLGRVVNIWKGDLAPKRDPRHYVLDLACNSAILTWVVALLIWGQP